MRLYALLMTIVLALSGCSHAEPAATQTSEEPTFAPFSESLTRDVSDSANEFFSQALASCVESGLRAYAEERVVEVHVSGRDPVAFGPWYAEQDYYATDARDDGSLTEWSDDYFIAHEWSDYGRQILSFEPGDSVTVNGRHVVLEGVFNYPKDSYYDEIELLVGPDAVVFQTCYPDSEYNRIAYGH